MSFLLPLERITTGRVTENNADVFSYSLSQKSKISPTGVDATVWSCAALPPKVVPRVHTILSMAEMLRERSGSEFQLCLF